MADVTPGAGESDGGDADNQTTTTPSVGPWHILGLLLIVAGIVLLVLILRPKWNGDTDTVTGVLAVTIPAFATVGAAIFGATVAYGAGKATGETAGKAKGEANKAQAVKDGRRQLAEATLMPLRRAHDSVGRVVGPLAELRSRGGERHFLIESAELPGPINIPVDDMQQVPAGVQQAIDRLEEELAESSR